jgi:[acyl-carrier-protein] S-malonyltransferase
VISNVTARQVSSPDEIRRLLILQVDHTTLWEESIRFMEHMGICTFFEIGPGKVLKGLLRRINPDLKVYNLENREDIESVLNCFPAHENIL